MSNALEELKKRRKAADKKLVELATKSEGYEPDPRFWKPTADKDKTCIAEIRLLGGSTDEDVDVVELYCHNFAIKYGDEKKDARYFIENCPTTIEKGDTCPVCLDNKPYYDTGLDSDKAIARPRRRLLSYITNIYVVKDVANPSAEGKVFLFKMGLQLYGIIKKASIPNEYEENGAVFGFNPWEDGANLIVRRTFKEGSKDITQTTYEMSKFKTKGALFPNDDEKLEEILQKRYSLKEFIAPDQFKSFAELEKTLKWVLAGKKKTSDKTSIETTESEKPSLPPPSAGKTAMPETTTKVDTSIEEDDAFFDNLVDKE